VAGSATQAPELVILLACPAEGSKIPVWEQELSCGAAGMNLLHGAAALGFGGGWVTGWAAYSPEVLEALGGKAPERVAGFIFLGTAGAELEERPRPALEQVAREW
jgi:nitroreductase